MRSLIFILFDDLAFWKMPSEIWQSAETWNWRSLRELTIFARWRTWTECNSRFIWRLTKTITDLSQCRNIIGNWFTILFQIRRRPCWVSTTRTTKWCKRTLSVPMYAIRFHGSLGPAWTLTDTYKSYTFCCSRIV